MITTGFYRDPPVMTVTGAFMLVQGDYKQLFRHTHERFLRQFLRSEERVLAEMEAEVIQRLESKLACWLAGGAILDLQRGRVLLDNTWDLIDLPPSYNAT